MRDYIEDELGKLITWLSSNIRVTSGFIANGAIVMILCLPLLINAYFYFIAEYLFKHKIVYWVILFLGLFLIFWL